MNVEYRSIDPSTDEVLNTFSLTSSAEALRAVERANRASKLWRRTDPAVRSEALRRLAQGLREGRSELAVLMAKEMGKPLPQGEAEIDKCAWACDYYADQGPEFLRRQEVPTDATRSYVAVEPLGVILAIMPWNFPFWQIVRCLTPSLLAGNAVLFKPAPTVGGCAEATTALVRDAGFPPDLFTHLFLTNEGVEELIALPLIRGVTLTGSTRAGRSVAARAGQFLKKTVMELGGSDAYVILDDADVESAASTCVASRLINSGQSCIAAKRFIVTKKNREAFERAVVREMNRTSFGPPLRGTFGIGPLARKDLRDTLHRQVECSVAGGALRLLGGQVPPGPGAFYPPTVLTDVRPGQPAFDEETFGPVAAVVPADNEEEALTLANATSYGLGAAVFSRDASRAERMARERLEAGSCFVNAFVKSDPRLPFGGVKESGYGRELSAYGMFEFVNVKTIYVH
jgi:succinate-semialdehyde dehydrogenase/glutarate-semialdehyde dehydrogenase